MRKIRVVIAKPGLDGHDRGAKVIARALRDAGMEVIYTGLRQTPEQIAAAALQEDADVIGLSILSGAHMHICPRLMELLREKGLEHVIVLVGGIIPDVDIPKLKAMGIPGVFLPGSPMQEIVTFINQHVPSRAEAISIVKKATLLLADDSVTIQRVIELTFANEEIRVVAVSDGAQAVRWIDLERPDIVLADVSMPQVDGYAVSSHVKQSASLREIPVLLLTGAFEPVDEEKARASGCDGVLVKPFEPKQLVTRVKELLGRKASRQAAAPSGADAAPAVSHPGPVPTAGHSAPPSPAVPAPVPLTADLELEEIDAALEASMPAGAVPPSTVEPDVPILMTEAEAPELSEPLETPMVDWKPSAFDEPEPLEPPKERVWELAVAARRQPAKSGPPAVANKLSLANAFSALLSAEQAQPAAPQSMVPVVTEAMVEDVVRKVLTRLTGDMVRSVVLDAAERLVREEIEKIKGSE